jgi:hypothetical protein
LWGNAHSREALIADFSAFARHLSLPVQDVEDQSLIVSAVKRWLESNAGWLLILDNADELKLLSEFLPANEQGYLLLTTRATVTRPLATQQSVNKMEPSEGALFLLRRIGEVEKTNPLESASEALQAQAEALAKELDGLPLALDQAAAFIDATNISPEKYLSLFRTERAELLALRGELSIDHPSVAVTFSLAFKKVEDASPTAADLLRACAFLEADVIPEEIFSQGAEELGDFLSLRATDPLKLTQVIAEAGRFSLLQRNPQANTVSIHRLVQAVLKDEMGSEAQRLWTERAIRAVNKAFPDAVEYSDWQLCSRLIPHTQLLAAYIDEYNFEFPEAARMMNQAGEYLNERAQYGEAEPLYLRALAVREKKLGAQHPDVATSLNDLAVLYNSQGKYGQAKLLYVRALAIREKVLGAEHPSVATSLNNLALLYADQGKYGEAEPLNLRALAIREKALGVEHPDVANSLNNLAGLYYNQGKYGEAEPLHLRALAIREKALGAEHPDVANSLNNLAGLYDGQGKYGEAEQLHLRALAIREKALGAEHPDVANSLNNLAGLYQVRGKYSKIEPLLKRALAIREKAFGANHPNVITVLIKYAGLLRHLNRHREAQKMETRIKQSQSKKEHPSGR